MLVKYLKYFLHTDSSEKCYTCKLHPHYIVMPRRGFLKRDFVYLKARFLLKSFRLFQVWQFGIGNKVFPSFTWVPMPFMHKK